MLQSKKTVRPDGTPSDSPTPCAPFESAGLREVLISNPALLNMNSICSAVVGPYDFVPMAAFDQHLTSYGFGFLTAEAIDVVKHHASSCGERVVSVFTGLGYAEAQLLAAGLSVVGFDRYVYPNRWLKDVTHADGGVEVSQLSEGILFMCFPDYTTASDYSNQAQIQTASLALDILARFKEAGGTRAVVITESRGAEHRFGTDQVFLDRLAQADCLARVDLPAWPRLEVLCSFRRGPTNLKPVLSVYAV